MNRSLKSVIPDLASVLNEKDAALYERQRALVREGLLESRPGRGPGTGVMATPYSVAMLLVGIMASVGLSEAGQRARAMAETVVGESIVPDGAGHCRLTGEIRFVDVLAKLLADESMAARVRRIQVAATRGWARIEFSEPRRGTGISTFYNKDYRGPTRTQLDNPGLEILVAISRTTTRAIASVVSGLSQEGQS